MSATSNVSKLPTTNYEAMIATPALNISPNEAQNSALLRWLGEHRQIAETRLPDLDVDGYAGGGFSFPAVPEN